MNNRTIVITGTSTLNVKTDYVKIKFDIDKKDLSYEKTLLLLTEQIDAMNDSQFNKWMSYHLYACEKEHGIGYSSSIVYIIKKIDLSV